MHCDCCHAEDRLDGGLHLWLLLSKQLSRAGAALAEMSPGYAHCNMNLVSQVLFFSQDPFSKEIPKDYWTKRQRCRQSSSGADGSPLLARPQVSVNLCIK